MSNVNPIKFGIAGQYYQNQTQEERNTTQKQEASVTQNGQKKVDSNEVFAFMAAQNTDMVPVSTPRTVDISKYVSEEEEARIADFMNSFEANYDEAFSIAAEEFPDLSQEAAVDLALAYINASYEE